MTLDGTYGTADDSLYICVQAEAFHYKFAGFKALSVSWKGPRDRNPFVCEVVTALSIVTCWVAKLSIPVKFNLLW